MYWQIKRNVQRTPFYLKIFSQENQSDIFLKGKCTISIKKIRTYNFLEKKTLQASNPLNTSWFFFPKTKGHSHFIYLNPFQPK